MTEAIIEPLKIDPAVAAWAKAVRNSGGYKKAHIPEWMRWYVFKRAHYRCQICGIDDGPFEADHIMPESRGGGTNTSNLQCLCPPCNRRKGEKVPEFLEDFLPRLGIRHA